MDTCIFANCIKRIHLAYSMMHQTASTLCYFVQKSTGKIVKQNITMKVDLHRDKKTTKNIKMR